MLSGGEVGEVTPTEREINYLFLNAEQRKQMSRGEDELQIADLPFFQSSLLIMSKSQERGGGRPQGPGKSAQISSSREKAALKRLQAAVCK